MRRHDREIVGREEILEILERADTIRLGLNGEFPYVVPLSFGFEECGGKLIVYFHCAKEGKKLELIGRDNRVCVEADLFSGYVRTEKSVTADYKSVIGFGRAMRVEGEEAARGMELILKHCRIEGFSARDCSLMNVVAVYKVVIDEITGKQRFGMSK